MHNFSEKGTEMWKAQRAKFLKAFANLPTDEQDQIIIIIEGIPCSWKRAFDEVKAETTLGKNILHKMGEFDLL